MGAVNHSVDPAVYRELERAREIARQQTDDTLWNLEYNIDTAVAKVIKDANIQGDIETAVRTVLNDFKQRHPF
jgi:hypothetical protein